LKAAFSIKVEKPLIEVERFEPFEKVRKERGCETDYNTTEAKIAVGRVQPAKLKTESRLSVASNNAFGL
jgi:hypothetical protein